MAETTGARALNGMRIRDESAGNARNDIPTTAHNPEVVGSSPSLATKQIPKEWLNTAVFGDFSFSKIKAKTGNSDFDPCLTHTGIFTEKQWDLILLRRFGQGKIMSADISGKKHSIIVKPEIPSDG
ncbi:MAG: hypothetical protein IJK98_01815 [Clostridia bacterium]|nr:hypothetical protein [Clostridia bacterium]